MLGDLRRSADHDSGSLGLTRSTIKGGLRILAAAVAEEVAVAAAVAVPLSVAAHMSSAAAWAAAWAVPTAVEVTSRAERHLGAAGVNQRSRPGADREGAHLFSTEC